MPRTYRLTAAAQQQQIDIYRYNLQRWGGEAPADRLLEEFHELFEAISTGDEPGRLIQAEYDVAGRYVRCGKHFAYWKALASGEIGIAEILHERMNLGDHLAGSVALNEPRDE